MTTTAENTAKTSSSLHLETSRLKPKKILVTTDFSAFSDVALKIAVSLAQRFAASVTILRCVPPVAYTAGIEAIGQDLFDVMVSTAEARLRDEVAICPNLHSIEHHLQVETGPLLQVVNDIVEENHIDMIVCGSHGAKGPEKAALGSTAEAILRHARCPVLVVGPNCEARIFKADTILLCTALTQGSLRPAQYAAALAEEMNAQLTVMHAAPTHTYGADKIARLRFTAQMIELLPKDINNWSKVRTIVVFGKAIDKILPIAQREKTQLIVMGVAEGMLADHLPWGTLTSVIQGASCPVLAVPGHFAK